MNDIFAAMTRLAISSGIRDLADERLESIFWERFGNAELAMQRHICLEIGKNRTARDAMVDNMLTSFMGWVADYFRAASIAASIRRNTVDDDSEIGLTHIAYSFGVTFTGGPEKSLADLLERHGFDGSQVWRLNKRDKDDDFTHELRLNANVTKLSLDFDSLGEVSFESSAREELKWE
jgi:hypothetical protein